MKIVKIVAMTFIQLLLSPCFGIVLRRDGETVDAASLDFTYDKSSNELIFEVSMYYIGYIAIGFQQGMDNLDAIICQYYMSGNTPVIIARDFIFENYSSVLDEQRTGTPGRNDVIEPIYEIKTVDDKGKPASIYKFTFKRKLVTEDCATGADIEIKKGTQNQIAIVAKKDDKGQIKKHEDNELFMYSLYICVEDNKVYILNNEDASPCKANPQPSSSSLSSNDNKESGDWLVLTLLIVASALIIGVVILLVIKSISRGRTSDYELNR